MRPLRVLITNNTLAARAGTELWVRDLAAGHEDLTHAPEVEPETRTAARAPAIPTAPDEAAPELVPSERYSRSMFLGLSTLGLGAVIGGILIGLIETMWSAYFSIDYKDVAAFSVLAITLIFLPQGLFGRPDVEKV